MPIPYVQLFIAVTAGVLGFLLFRQLPSAHEHGHGQRSSDQDYYPPPRNDSPPPRRRYAGTCPICMEDIPERNMRKLSCGHALHRQCYEEAKKYSKNCPVCRKVML